MKLLFCPQCQDVRKLQNHKTYCACRKSFGRYTDDLNATYGGLAAPVGIANSSFSAVFRQSRLDETIGVVRNSGRTFEAFFIPWNAPTIKFGKI